MKLLQIEFMKLKGNKSFWIFSLLFLVFLPVLVVFVPLMASEEFNGIKIYPLMPSTAESTWYVVTWISSYFSMFLLSFIIIFHIVNEYAYRTARQNIIDGLTRYEFTKGKFYLLLVLAVLATLYVFLIGMIVVGYFETLPKEQSLQDMMGALMKTVSEPVPYGSVFDGVHNVIGFFIQIIGYFSFGVFVSFLVKRGALAILIYFVAFIAEKIIGFMFFKELYVEYKRFFPLGSMSNILPNPELTAIFKGLGAPNEITPLNILIVLGYASLLLFFSNYLFQKRDID